MSDTMISRLAAGRYERAEARRAPNITRPGDRVLEFGSAIGYISCLLARQDDVRFVHGYDANPHMAAHATKVAAANGLAAKTRFETALISTDHDAPASGDFHLHRDFWASSTRKSDGTVETVRVPVRDANALIIETRPTLLVCDVEGGEKDLFGNLDLSGVDRVMVELHQKVIGRTGMKDVFDCFSSRGFHYDQYLSAGAVVVFCHVDSDWRSDGARRG